MGRIKKRGTCTSYHHVILEDILTHHRNGRQRQKLHNPLTGRPQTSNLPPRLPTTVHLQGNLSARASIQEASLQILDAVDNILLHQRHLVSPPRTAPRQIPRPKSPRKEDQQSSRAE